MLRIVVITFLCVGKGGYKLNKGKNQDVRLELDVLIWIHSFNMCVCAHACTHTYYLALSTESIIL